MRQTQKEIDVWTIHIEISEKYAMWTNFIRAQDPYLFEILHKMIYYHQSKSAGRVLAEFSSVALHDTLINVSGRNVATSTSCA